MRVIVTRGTLRRDLGEHRQDEVVDIPDDEAEALLSRKAVIREADAPHVLVISDWRNGGNDLVAGWIGRVSPETYSLMRQNGIAVPWPGPPAPAAPDPAFRLMPADWQGGPLLTLVRELILAAPEVRAFETLKETPYALEAPTLPPNLPVAAWNLAGWTHAFAKPPAPARPKPQALASPWIEDRQHWLRTGPSPEISKRKAQLQWWRTREVRRLACTVFDRLRSGEWQASGVRDDMSDAPRQDIPAERWNHPRYVLQWEPAGAALRPAADAPAALPHYVALCVRPAQAGTAGAESRCRAWLRKEVAANPDRPPHPKAALKAYACRQFGVSAHGFGRVWAAEAPPTWKKPGRKSNHHGS